MRTKSHGFQMAVPSPEEQLERQERLVTAMRAEVEQADPRGAVLTLLQAVGLMYKGVVVRDVEGRMRMQSLAELVMARGGQEVMGPKSAQRLVDRMLEAVDADWTKRGL